MACLKIIITCNLSSWTSSWLWPLIVTTYCLPIFLAMSYLVLCLEVTYWTPSSVIFSWTCVHLLQKHFPCVCKCHCVKYFQMLYKTSKAAIFNDWLTSKAAGWSVWSVIQGHQGMLRWGQLYTLIMECQKPLSSIDSCLHTTSANRMQKKTAWKNGRTLYAW